MNRNEHSHSEWQWNTAISIKVWWPNTRITLTNKLFIAFKMVFFSTTLFPAKPMFIYIIFVCCWRNFAWIYIYVHRWSFRNQFQIMWASANILNGPLDDIIMKFARIWTFLTGKISSLPHIPTLRKMLYTFIFLRNSAFESTVNQPQASRALIWNMNYYYCCDDYDQYNSRHKSL